MSGYILCQHNSAILVPHDEIVLSSAVIFEATK